MFDEFSTTDFMIVVFVGFLNKKNQGIIYVPSQKNTNNQFLGSKCRMLWFIMIPDLEKISKKISFFFGF